MTKMQATIIAIADEAKANHEDPITAVQEYFEEKDSRFPRERVAAILQIARETKRREEKHGLR